MRCEPPNMDVQDVLGIPAHQT